MGEAPSSRRAAEIAPCHLGAAARAVFARCDGDRYRHCALGRARYRAGFVNVGGRVGSRRRRDLACNPAATFSVAVAELKRFRLGYLHIVEPSPSDPIAAGEPPDIKYFRKLWPGPLMGNKGYDVARANTAQRPGKNRILPRITALAVVHFTIRPLYNPTHRPPPGEVRSMGPPLRTTSETINSYTTRSLEKADASLTCAEATKAQMLTVLDTTVDICFLREIDL